MPKRKPPNPLRLTPPVPLAHRVHYLHPTLFHEFFLPFLDKPYKHPNEFLSVLTFLNLHSKPLTHGEYILLRFAVCTFFPGCAGRKPRRFSTGFLEGERVCLEHVRTEGRRRWRGAKEGHRRRNMGLLDIGDECLVLLRKRWGEEDKEVAKKATDCYWSVEKGVFLGYVNEYEDHDDDHDKKEEGTGKSRARCRVKLGTQKSSKLVEHQDREIVVNDFCIMDLNDRENDDDDKRYAWAVKAAESDHSPLSEGARQTNLDTASTESPRAVQVSAGGVEGESVRLDVDVRLLAECIALMDRKEKTVCELRTLNNRLDPRTRSEDDGDMICTEVERLIRLLSELNRRLDVLMPGLRPTGGLRKGVERVPLTMESAEKKRTAEQRELFEATNGFTNPTARTRNVNAKVLVSKAGYGLDVVEGANVLSKALVRSAFDRLEDGCALKGASLAVRADVMECVGKCVALLLRARLTKNSQQVLEALENLSAGTHRDAIENIRNAASLLGNVSAAKLNNK